MNSDERIDRLERPTKLFARAGRRGRQRLGTVVRTAEEKIDIIIDFQIATEERFARNEERFAELEEAQPQSDRRLNAFIEAIERDRNVHSR